MKDNHIKFTTPEARPRLGLPKYIYDYDICAGDSAMVKCMQTINENGWELVGVTYVDEAFYVFFRRPANE